MRLRSRQTSLGLTLWIASVTSACNADLLFPTDLRQKSYSTALDTDGDGLSDRDELQAGFDPDDPDSNDDGLSDKDGDEDGDGLTNYWEILLGFDPKDADSASAKYDPTLADNSKNDCDEDLDADGSSNCWELGHGLDPLDDGD